MEEQVTAPQTHNLRTIPFQRGLSKWPERGRS